MCLVSILRLLVCAHQHDMYVGALWLVAMRSSAGQLLTLREEIAQQVLTDSCHRQIDNGAKMVHNLGDDSSARTR